MSDEPEPLNSSLRELAYHEVGHAIAMELEGVEVDYICVKEDLTFGQAKAKGPTYPSSTVVHSIAGYVGSQFADGDPERCPAMWSKADFENGCEFDRRDQENSVREILNCVYKWADIVKEPAVHALAVEWLYQVGLKRAYEHLSQNKAWLRAAADELLKTRGRVVGEFRLEGPRFRALRPNQIMEP